MRDPFTGVKTADTAQFSGGTTLSGAPGRATAIFLDSGSETIYTRVTGLILTPVRNAKMKSTSTDKEEIRSAAAGVVVYDYNLRRYINRRATGISVFPVGPEYPPKKPAK
jgi:hypothetical protein